MSKKKILKRNESELDNLTLGKTTTYQSNYNPKLLESFENKNKKSDAWTTFICTEFTSLCPKTGQPDFAKIFINYIADKTMIESKSLKLYLFSFRNHGGFHEDCIQTICDDLKKLIKPKYIEVIGEFTPRGGISIFPYCQAANSQSKYLQIKKSRFTNYAPCRYTMSLNKLY